MTLPAGIKRHRFDVGEYHRMGEVGLLGEDSRVELIEGEIIEMTPIGWRHMSVVNRLNKLLVERVPDGYLVSVQNPLRLSDLSEPEPDFVVLTDEPRERVPTPEDAPLVIEVSDTTRAYDEQVKLPLYAASGVREVWVFDLQDRRVEAYAEPSPNGYGSMRAFGVGEKVESSVLEGLSVAADEALA